MGDEFDQIVSEHRSRLYTVVLGVVADPELAADVMQETFIRAWRGLARFRGEAAIGEIADRGVGGPCTYKRALI